MFLDELIITTMVTKWRFSNTITPPAFISYQCALKKSFLFSFIYASISISLDLWVLLYPRGSNLLLSLFI